MSAKVGCFSFLATGRSVVEVTRHVQDAKTAQRLRYKIHVSSLQLAREFTLLNSTA